MGVFSKVKDFEKKKAQRKADAMSTVGSPSINPQSESVTQGFKQMAQSNDNQPALDKMTWKNTGIVPMAGQGEYRTEALRDMNEQEFAQNQAKMNASEKEYWVEQAKANPTSTYANLKSYLASSETPEEKAKREKRERLGEVFNNLGNLIGNAANLYYTSKGGQYIDLNAANEKHQARMDAIKAKQDALKQRQDELLMQYKVADIQAAREAAAKKESQEREDAIRKENRAYQEQKDKQNQENWNKQFEFNAKQAEQAAADKAEEQAYRRERDKQDLAYKWASLNARKGDSSEKKNKIEVVDTKKGVMTVDFGKLNEASISQLYQKTPKEIKEKYDVKGIDNKNEKLMLMNEAIGEALLNVDGYSDWFEKAGIGAYQQQRKPIDYSQFLEDDYSGFVRKGTQMPTYNQTNNTVVTSDDIQAALDLKNRKKNDILQAGKDSLFKKSNQGMRSDTFK